MARSRTKSRVHHKKAFTVPLAIVAGFIPMAMDINKQAPSMGWLGSAAHTTAGLIGWDTVGGSYVGWTQAKAAGLPGIALGFGGHWLASKLGVNRMIARAGIPFIRI